MLDVGLGNDAQQDEQELCPQRERTRDGLAWTILCTGFAGDGNLSSEHGGGSAQQDGGQ